MVVKVAAKTGKTTSLEPWMAARTGETPFSLKRKTFSKLWEENKKPVRIIILKNNDRIIDKKTKSKSQSTQRQ